MHMYTCETAGCTHASSTYSFLHDFISQKGQSASSALIHGLVYSPSGQWQFCTISSIVGIDGFVLLHMFFSLEVNLCDG